MPFYEYQCDSCGAHHEVLQKISDEPLKKCPDCGKSKLKRLISAPVFRLKGGGWYETDFKSEQEKKRNLAGREEESSSDSSKTEAKEAAPAETKTEAKKETPKPAGKKTAKPAAKSVKAKPTKAAAKKKAKR